MSVTELFIADVKDNCDIESISKTGSLIEVCVSHEREKSSVMQSCSRYPEVTKTDQIGDVYGTTEEQRLVFKVS